jgi:hypothetical protein
MSRVPGMSAESMLRLLGKAGQTWFPDKIIAIKVLSLSLFHVHSLILSRFIHLF